MSVADLEHRIAHCKRDLVQRFSHFGQLVLYMSSGETNRLNVPESLVTFFGLSVVVNIMQRFNQSDLTVNGVGLRYGICVQILAAHYPDLESGVHHQTFLSRRKSHRGITERSSVQGVVSSITDWGFVRLKGNITGLIHRTQLSTKLRKGQSITVYVRRIYQDPKGEWKIELVL